jgi:hypothetical protein
LDILAVITEPSVVDRILRHIRTHDIADPFDTARAPPHPSTRASIA